MRGQIRRYPLAVHANQAQAADRGTVRSTHAQAAGATSDRHRFGTNESQERPMKAGQISLRSSERFTTATDEELSTYRAESYHELIAGCGSFFRDLHVALCACHDTKTRTEASR